MRNAEVEAVQSELERYEIRSEIIERGKHLEVAWCYNGLKGSTIVARTGSDVRGWLNARGEVRRWLRTNNVPLPVYTQPRVLQKALSLPLQTDTGPARLAALEQNFDALLDMVADLSAAHAELLSTLASLNARFNNMRIVSHISFEEPALVVAQPSAEVVPILSLVERKPAVRNTGSASGSAAVLEHIKDGRWYDRKDIASALGSDPTRVSQTLNYLSTKGLVENGQRGMWRKVIVA